MSVTFNTGFGNTGGVERSNNGASVNNNNNVNADKKTGNTVGATPELQLANKVDIAFGSKSLSPIKKEVTFVDNQKEVSKGPGAETFGALAKSLNLNTNSIVADAILQAIKAV